ncbi:MAG: anthranilate phosphoribosyltransferase [Planctomycetes bacterium]|nr:anthranilate phosphoribosyltransferase [Planctomycetota bacterium]
MTATATLEHITLGRSLSAPEARELARHLLDENTPEALIAGYLTALRAKGENGDELLGVAQAMLAAARTLHGVPEGAVDTCGTGGDGSGTFNISTAAGLLAAACGIPVVKHGNRSITSRSGSADVIEALGLPFQTPDAAMADKRFAFLFAPQFHPALKRVGAVRRALGMRTVFNLVGPLANPAQPQFQLVGVADAARLADVAHALRGLGRGRAFVVHGEPGLDEATPAGPVTLLEVSPAGVQRRRISAADFGLPPCSLTDLKGGDALENASIIRAVFRGEQGARRDTVVLNAALVLLLTGRAADPREAAQDASITLDSGRALQLLAELGASRA